MKVNVDISSDELKEVLTETIIENFGDMKPIIFVEKEKVVFSFTHDEFRSGEFAFPFSEILNNTIENFEFYIEGFDIEGRDFIARDIHKIVDALTALANGIAEFGKKSCPEHWD